MTEAYIYDAIRTPRGKGKNTGSLHELSPVKLASKTLKQSQKVPKLYQVILGQIP